MTIRPYAPQDRQKLCDLFAELIENHKEYISHGELQMGIATDRGELAPISGTRGSATWTVRRPIPKPRSCWPNRTELRRGSSSTESIATEPPPTA